MDKTIPSPNLKLAKELAIAILYIALKRKGNINIQT